MVRPSRTAELSGASGEPARCNHTRSKTPPVDGAARSGPFLARERLRTLVGVVLYALAAPLAVLVYPAAALAIFLVLPVFYGITSHGLTDVLRYFASRR